MPRVRNTPAIAPTPNAVTAAKYQRLTPAANITVAPARISISEVPRFGCISTSTVGVMITHVGIGLPYLLAKALSFGAGDVRAIGYEYGNAFLVVAGLLNLLVVIDSYDIALGRK